jgi:TonB family protein
LTAGPDEVEKLWPNIILSLFRAIVLLSLALALFGESLVYAQEGARREEGEKEAPPPPTLTAPPELLEAAAPTYPEAASAAGLSAEVKVRIRIEADGSVSTVDVLQPVGNGFDEAAVAAAKQYRFKPAEWDGVPGSIVVETSIHFVLEVVEEEVEEPVSEAAPEGEKVDPAAEGPPEHGGDFRKPVSISGVALERGTRRKLAGVIVSIAELGLDVITDAKGRFYFHGVAPGHYQIIAIDDRFDRFTRTMDLEKNEVVDLKLYMRPRGGNPYETVVEGERERLEVTRRTLQRRQLTTVPGTFGDPIRVIQSLPGLARTPFVSGFLLIRGSNPDDSGVFIDGHRVPLLFHFLGGPSVLNAEFLDSIDLYPGGYPARYGRAIGGIVSVDTRSSKSDGVHGSADIDILDAGGYLRFPIGEKGSMAVAGRRSYLDFMLGFFLPEEKPGQTLIVVPVYDDEQVRLDYDFGRQGKASLFYLRSSDTLKVLSKNAEDQSALALNSSIGFDRLMASYSRTIAGGLKLTLGPAMGTDIIEVAGGPGDGESAFFGVEVVADYIDYRMRVDGKIGEHFYLDTGIDLESRRTRYELFIPVADDIRNEDDIDVPPELFIRNIDTLMLGMHADLAIDIDKLRLVPGLRMDGYLLNAHPQWTIDPRLVGRYQLTTDWLVKGYAGLFHQPPQPEALDPEFGNPEIEPERAVHLGLGGEWNFAPHWDLDFEGYFIDRTNQVTNTDEVVVDEDTGAIQPLYWANTRVGDTIGFEFLLRRQVTQNFFGWISYTLSKTRQRNQDQLPYSPSAFDQRHTLNLVASYTLDSGWEFGGRYRLATGRPITDVVDSTFDADSGGYQRIDGERFGARRKTFSQLDARVEKTWLFDTWRIGVYVDVQNVLNTVNEEGTQYDYRFRERSPVASVPFIPTLGVRGQF